VSADWRNFKTFNAWSDTYHDNIDTTKEDAQNRPDPRTGEIRIEL